MTYLALIEAKAAGRKSIVDRLTLKPVATTRRLLRMMERSRNERMAKAYLLARSVDRRASGDRYTFVRLDQAIYWLIWKAH